MCPPPADLVLLTVLGLWALALAVDDVRHRRVLNLALLPVASFALAARIWGGWPGCELSWLPGFWGALIGLLFWLPGYLLKRSGAGDVKCAMTMGLVLGGMQALEANLLGFLFLGMQAAVFYALGRRELRMPAVPALSLGFIIQLAGGPWWLGAAGA